jgi:uncharacterized protein YdgA (DUF945 family)
MKKIRAIILILLALAAVWLGATWYTGTRVEAVSSDIIARINENWAEYPMPNGVLNLRQVSYERGLFSSQGHFVLTLAPTFASSSQEEQLLEFDMQIWHGPFPLAALQEGSFLPRQYQTNIELKATGIVEKISSQFTNGEPQLVFNFGCDYGQHCVGTGGMPAITTDASGSNRSFAFGGMQMRWNVDYQSATDYRINGDVQFLPLSIDGQNFGSGQFTISGDAQSLEEIISWKTDQGESKLMLALTASQPMPMWDASLMTEENRLKMIKTVLARLELSRPMLVGLIVRMGALHGVDPVKGQKRVEAAFAQDMSNPVMQRFIRVDGDLLISDWQYADDKLVINGQERPDMLEGIKQIYWDQMQYMQQFDEVVGASSPPSLPSAFIVASKNPHTVSTSP